MTGSVAQWADFVTSVNFDDLPPDVVDRTKLAVLDSLAVAGAGATTPISTAVESYVASQEGSRASAPGAFRLYPGDVTVDNWELAGLAQGVRGYGHLYGDTSLRSVSHPGPVVISSALTTAQRTKASGRDVIVAVALGYQVLEAFAIELNGRPPRMALQIRGFRPTAICGPLAATATAGKLLGLDRDELANSLALAANFASGLRPNDGDPAAAILLQTGTAVQTGHAAINLSQAGVRGHPHALEGPGGFLEAYTGRKSVTVAPQPRWAILDTAVKLHATAHTLAPVADMLLALQRTHGFTAGGVDEIVIRVPSAHLKISGADKPLPTSSAEATSHYAFGAAAALVTGDYLWPSALNRLLGDENVAALAAKVRIQADADHTAAFDSGEQMWPASVEVRVRGQLLTATVDRPDGTAYSEETVGAVTRKFEMLSKDWPAAVDVRAVREYVANMEAAPDFFSGLVDASRPPR